MNGADSLIQTLIAHGVDTCFANPGTSEMHMVQGIDASDEFNPVLCLFEGVCTGAADGFGRMRGLPATTLLHLGAGLGNGIANLHNCRRAATPLINIVGDHARHHVPYDAPLTSDVEAVAKPVSAWIRTSRTSEGLGVDTREAIQASLSHHPDPLGNIATLIVPADCAWGPGNVQLPVPMPEKALVNRDVIEDVSTEIDAETILLVDGDGLLEEGVKAAGRIAATTGCQVFSPTFPSRVECGPDLPLVNRMPYFPEHILALLQNVKKLVLVGGEAPVSFFAYQNVPSYLVPEHCEVFHVAHRHQNVVQALSDLADEIDARPAIVADGSRPELPEGKISVRNVAAILASSVPDNSIVTVDSGGGGAAYPAMQSCVRHSWMNLTGGSIGMGGPAAVGAAIACPDRPVYALLGDGGAMYTNQYLWTAARENLNLTSIIFSNQQYNILEVEYLRMGVNQVGETAARLFDLSDPAIDWVGLAKAQGVPATRATTCEEFRTALERAKVEDGPFLVEAMI